MTRKAPFFVILIVALLLLSPLFFGQVEAISTKQPKHRKLGKSKHFHTFVSITLTDPEPITSTKYVRDFLGLGRSYNRMRA